MASLPRLLLLSGAPLFARANTGDPYVNEAPLGPAFGCEMHKLAYEFAQCAHSLLTSISIGMLPLNLTDAAVLLLRHSSSVVWPVGTDTSNQSC